MVKNTKLLIIGVIIVIVAVGGYLFYGQFLSGKNGLSTMTNATRYAGKKILWVSSYNAGMPWQDGLGRGIHAVLDKTGAELRVFELDTKEHPQTATQKAKEAKVVIDEFQPDVIIASDDNAQKYLVVPHLANSNIPIIFIAVNWDASSYGYPTAHITGMLEVDLVQSLTTVLKDYVKGDAVGHIGLSNETFLKNSDTYNKKFFNGKMKVYPVKSYAEFKSAYLKAQSQVNMLFVANFDGMPGWNIEEGKKFILENTTIPTGYFDGYLLPDVLVTMGKIPEEQGEYAASTALKVLDGQSVSGMPIVINEKGDLGLNLQLAEKLGIVFQPSTLKAAKTVITKDGTVKQLRP